MFWNGCTLFPTFMCQCSLSTSEEEVSVLCVTVKVTHCGSVSDVSAAKEDRSGSQRTHLIYCVSNFIHFFPLFKGNAGLPKLLHTYKWPYNSSLSRFFCFFYGGRKCRRQTPHFWNKTKPSNIYTRLHLDFIQQMFLFLNVKRHKIRFKLIQNTTCVRREKNDFPCIVSLKARWHFRCLHTNKLCSRLEVKQVKRQSEFASQRRR